MQSLYIPSIQYNNLFILLIFINSITICIMDYNYISIFLYLNSISINYILYKDFYFEIKHKYSNINFVLMPNYYPSNRTINKFILYTNIFIIYSGLLFICIDFWINKYEGMNITSYKYFISLLSISTISILSFLIIFLSTIYSLYVLFVQLLNNINQILNNYINNKNLLYFPNNYEPRYYCWICNRSLNKLNILKKLNCPCKEYFHPDCIDKYLGLYNNYCKNNHKISKYEHTV